MLIPALDIALTARASSPGMALQRKVDTPQPCTMRSGEVAATDVAHGTEIGRVASLIPAGDGGGLER